MAPAKADGPGGTLVTGVTGSDWSFRPPRVLRVRGERKQVVILTVELFGNVRSPLSLKEGDNFLVFTNDG